MINLFKKLPLRAKLILIGFIPLLFLICISMEFYWLEWKKYNQSIDDIQVVSRSSMVNRLMDQLQEERRFAYEYALKKEGYTQLIAQQENTSQIIDEMEKDPDLRGFEKYTMLDSLNAVRKKSDSHKLSVDQVMNYYTISIFRISMIEVIPQLQVANSGQLNRELRSARAMSQIITYLGILRSNIYNVLYSRQYKYGSGTLQGLLGPYDVFSTYQTEFKAKAPPEFLSRYDAIVPVSYTHLRA